MRRPLEKLGHASRLINHGPTVLVSTAAEDERNVMAAAWVMALDFDPPKLAIVIASDTHTRALLQRSGEFALSLPTAEQMDLTYAVGNVSGRDVDKFQRFGIRTFQGAVVRAPLLEGCAAWLECRVLEEPEMAARYDLFIAEIVGASVDDELFAGGEWRFPSPGKRTIHHQHRGIFFATGERLEARSLDAAE